MSPDNGDRILRQAFTSLYDRIEAPSFESVFQERPARPAVPLRALSVSALAVLLVAGIVFLVVDAGLDDSVLSPDDELMLAESVTSWQTPLDFLLETPGEQYWSASIEPALDTRDWSVPGFGSEEILQ